MKTRKIKNIFLNDLTREQVANVYADFIYRNYDVTNLKDWDVGYEFAMKMSDLDLTRWVEDNPDLIKEWKELNL
jgi:hypothetical protein